MAYLPDPVETRGNGTPRAIGPVAEQVLGWVSYQRRLEETEESHMDADDLRRIELCAQAAREAAMFYGLYGMGA